MTSSLTWILRFFHEIIQYVSLEFCLLYLDVHIDYKDMFEFLMNRLSMSLYRIFFLAWNRNFISIVEKYITDNN